MSMDSCEKHGWWEVNGQDACPSCEIILLRAEVNRLTLSGDYETSLMRERDEASAQVAVLHRKIQSQLGHPSPLGSHKKGHDPHFACAVCEWYGDIPAEARALLDRLQRAEAVMKSQWEHLCSDGVGGCTAVSAEALAAWEEGKA